MNDLTIKTNVSNKETDPHVTFRRFCPQRTKSNLCVCRPPNDKTICMSCTTVCLPSERIKQEDTWNSCCRLLNSSTTLLLLWSDCSQELYYRLAIRSPEERVTKRPRGPATHSTFWANVRHISSYKWMTVSHGEIARSLVTFVHSRDDDDPWLSWAAAAALHLQVCTMKPNQIKFRIIPESSGSFATEGRRQRRIPWLCVLGEPKMFVCLVYLSE